MAKTFQPHFNTEMRRREKQEARHRLARTVGIFVCLLTALVFYLYLSFTWSSSSNLSVDVSTKGISNKARKFALKQKGPAPRVEPNVLHADVAAARAKKRQIKQRKREQGIDDVMH